MEKTDHDPHGKVITYCSLSLACETSPVMDMLFPSYICPIYLGQFRIVIRLRFLLLGVEHKSLSHNKLAIFRVVVSLTLKMANYLITIRLHSTPYSEMSAWRGAVSWRRPTLKEMPKFRPR